MPVGRSAAAVTDSRRAGPSSRAGAPERGAPQPSYKFAPPAQRYRSSRLVRGTPA